MAQACHGALEAGRKFANPSDHTNSIIVIGCKNLYQLEKARAIIESNGIRTEMFWEPDFGPLGNTSFGTEPCTEEQRQHFSRFQLWKP
jgi:hypothetical protein